MKVNETEVVMTHEEFDIFRLSHARYINTLNVVGIRSEDEASAFKELTEKLMAVDEFKKGDQSNGSKEESNQETSEKV